MHVFTIRYSKYKINPNNLEYIAGHIIPTRGAVWAAVYA
jgi:hypothetical protein